MVDCSGFLEPLNLECLLVNTFAGTMEIFMIIAFLFVACVGAYFRMLNATLLIMFALFAIMFGQYLPGIYFIAILIAGLIISFAVARITKK